MRKTLISSTLFVMARRIDQMKFVILTSLIVASSMAYADFQVGKTYWFTGASCFRDKNRALECVGVDPIKARVYGISRSGTPLIQVLNGVQKGLKNSCYELPEGNAEYCQDSSESLLSVSPFDAATLSPGQRVRWARVAPMQPTADTPNPYTCVSARMIDTKSGDLVADFDAGQNLRSHGMPYTIPFFNRLAGLDHAISVRMFSRIFFVDPRNVRSDDRVEIFGEETFNSKTYYIARIYNKDGSKKGRLSNYFVYISPAEVVDTKF
jgi:hypothetical protein